MHTIDNGFPYTKQSKNFLQFWAELFQEYLRETKYMASLGGQDFSIQTSQNSFGLNF
jgi:hypothetical protein